MKRRVVLIVLVAVFTTYVFAWPLGMLVRELCDSSLLVLVKPGGQPST